MMLMPLCERRVPAEPRQRGKSTQLMSHGWLCAPLLDSKDCEVHPSKINGPATGLERFTHPLLLLLLSETRLSLRPVPKLIKPSVTRLLAFGFAAPVRKPGRQCGGKPTELSFIHLRKIVLCSKLIIRLQPGARNALLPLGCWGTDIHH